MKPFHTPGPWIAPKEQVNLVVPKKNWESDQLGDIKHGLQILINAPTEVEIRANAQLIAAAPDLLEACENLVVDFLKSKTAAPSLEVITAIADAITKAKGGT